MSSTQTPEPLFRPLGPDDPRWLGDFQVRARLGAGGMGRVYLGATSTGRRLAIKGVRSELAEDRECRLRFHREIDAAQRVRGPHTAAVVDADPEAERPCWRSSTSRARRSPPRWPPTGGCPKRRSAP